MKQENALESENGIILEGCPSSGQQRKLFQILLTEICRDGGVSYVNLLRNYSSSREIKLLLKQCSAKGIVSFLYRFPDVFDLDIILSNSRHIVRIKNLKCCDCCSSVGTQEGQAAAASLIERVTYLLQQRSCKLARRGRTQIETHHAHLNWLAHKALTEIHGYVRLLGPLRPVGNAMGSELWLESAMPIFIEFLKSHPRKFRLHGVSNAVVGHNWKDTTVEMAEPTVNDDVPNGKIEETFSRVMEILAGAPKVGGMDIGMLQEDTKLRQLLGGRDFIQMVHDNPCSFKGIKFFRDGSKEWRIVLNEKADHAATKQGWLVADEEGLYSVTASKTAAAMASCLEQALYLSCEDEINILQLHSRMQNHTTSEVSARQYIVLEQSVCIDLTAGVGGNTVASSKRFPSVVAIEIDKKRADLCQLNVNNNSGCYRDRVQVICSNSLDALSDLAKRFRSTDDHNHFYMCAMLDPPWGGLDYRARKDEEDEGLGLGPDAPLSRVVALVSHHLKPLVLGIKLPPAFDVTFFIDKMHGSDFCGSSGCEVLSIKKFKRQLFIVLHLT